MRKPSPLKEEVKPSPSQPTLASLPSKNEGKGKEKEVLTEDKTAGAVQKDDKRRNSLWFRWKGKYLVKGAPSKIVSNTEIYRISAERTKK